MNEKVKKLLEGRGGNYILPFFWQHGETEEVLRHYMKVIDECGIKAVCVESRPHPDYCGPKWWQDMDIILDEARRRNMKVWILDDSHFPTGYCNGALENGPDELRRQYLTCKIVGKIRNGEKLEISRNEYVSPSPFVKSAKEQYSLKKELKTFKDDVFLGVVAVKENACDQKDLILLEEKQEKISWIAENGTWTIYACHLTRNRGPHRDYINMCDREACHKLIEKVYEPHYAHYHADFGKTIAGFFSDEPEIGNGHLYEMSKRFYEVDDQPWSREVQSELELRWGECWKKYLPVIWDEKCHSDFSARIRFDFMDVVTRLVEKDFSWQIGDWCREHGVEYIGHLIEDNNQHSRCGSSLGHFFRGLAGQDMAGIDDIGGQVLPQCEDVIIEHFMNDTRDGIFYHYALGKLAASAAAIEPQKKGRAMCEIFGNYGWAEGVALEKYLADHFMVRGINRFVPHAFSPKAFPDPDCPPHFYAHGHNPQYRHFGKLMNYMNRICELISDGYHMAPVAVLYHGEADWTGGRCMFSQEPARKLADCQIDYDFIPSDVFTEKKYGTVLGKTLKIHTQEYQVLIIPECSYLLKDTAKAIIELSEKRFPVVFINSLPVGFCEGNDPELLEKLKKCYVVRLEELTNFVEKLAIREVSVFPKEPLIRYLHYENGSSMYYFVNESAEVYRGKITVNKVGEYYAYRAWENRLERLNGKTLEGQTAFEVCLEPRKSLIILFDHAETELNEPFILEGECLDISENWMCSYCSAIRYPEFKEEKQVSLPHYLEKEIPDFGGFICYKKNVEILDTKKVILTITGENEGVELFINGKSAGIQIVPEYRYDISEYIHLGINELRIETATTLERVVPGKVYPGMEPQKPQNHCGIDGKISLWMK